MIKTSRPTATPTSWSVHLLSLKLGVRIATRASGASLSRLVRPSNQRAEWTRKKLRTRYARCSASQFALNAKNTVEDLPKILSGKFVGPYTAERSWVEVPLEIVGYSRSEGLSFKIRDEAAKSTVVISALHHKLKSISVT
jgi:hypothetical protein